MEKGQSVCVCVIFVLGDCEYVYMDRYGLCVPCITFIQHIPIWHSFYGLSQTFVQRTIKHLFSRSLLYWFIWPDKKIIISKKIKSIWLMIQTGVFPQDKSYHILICILSHISCYFASWRKLRWANINYTVSYPLQFLAFKWEHHPHQMQIIHLVSTSPSPLQPSVAKHF